MPLRLGTRASALARWQAEWVAAQLEAQGVAVELIHITTQGDISQTDPIGNIGRPGVFTKELQRALLDERIDLAVHSLKDLPTDKVDGLVLAAVPPRESPFDVLISRDGAKLADLPLGALIGTDSLRRRAQLLFRRPDLEMQDIRGNVDTRLRKLREGQYQAIVLAEAGLNRLGLSSEITEVFDTSVMLPAIGQGALGIETRTADQPTRSALAALDDLATHQAVVAERTMLAALLGGCLAPVGGWARLASGMLHLDAVVLSPDGKQRLAAASSAAPGEAAALGEKVARQLLDHGAAQLIAGSRTSR